MSYNIKKIAVCMYGQPRTALSCLANIQSFYNIPDIEIDFFCSIKSYNPNDNTRSESEHAHTNVFKPEIENIVNRHYQSVDHSVLPLIIDKALPVYAFKAMSGIIDTLYLKQKHEAATNSYYDFVVLQRYDTLYRDTAGMANLISALNNENAKTQLKDDNVILTIHWPKPRSIQDMLIVGSNTAMNSFGAAMHTLTLPSFEHNSKYTGEQQPYVHRCAHSMSWDAARRSGATMYEIGEVFQKCLNIKYDIEATLVRDSKTIIDNNPMSPESYAETIKYFRETKQKS